MIFTDRKISSITGGQFAQVQDAERLLSGGRWLNGPGHGRVGGVLPHTCTLPHTPGLFTALHSSLHEWFQGYQTPLPEKFGLSYEFDKVRATTLELEFAFSSRTPQCPLQQLTGRSSVSSSESPLWNSG